jgi:hypothetical protein
MGVWSVAADAVGLAKLLSWQIASIASARHYLLR